MQPRRIRFRVAGPGVVVGQSGGSEPSGGCRGPCLAPVAGLVPGWRCGTYGRVRDP
jgi:hypothetical protein